MRTEQFLVLPPKDQNFIDLYNRGLEEAKIPKVTRNLVTGWPMLQISAFTLNETDKGSIKYENMFDNRKCNFFQLAGFFSCYFIGSSYSTKKYFSKWNKSAKIGYW